MARETKVGLLVGMAVILLIGIIVSDHLSAVQGSNPANMTNWAHRAQDSVTDRPRSEQYTGDVAPMAASNRATTPTAPILRADELNQPQPRPTPPPAQRPQAIGDGEVPLANVTVAHQTQQQGAVLAIHTVRQGETLGNIARQYYGGNVEGWKVIQASNPASLGRGGTGMREGTKLLIPRWTPATDPTPAYEAPQPAYQPPQPAPQQPIAAQQTRDTAADHGGLFAPVPDPHRAPGAFEGTMLKVVEVQQGQTLSMIAGKYLGDKARWKEILDANKDVISSPTQLQTGMKLKIPTNSPTAHAPSTMLSPTPSSANATATDSRPGVPWPTPTAVPTAATQKSYTVQTGDTLSSIAAKHLGDRAKWKDILAVNKGTIDSADDLHVGQVLMLPASSGR